MRSKVAYLVNQYPKVSHTFIRREIQALEALGQPVERISVRDMRQGPNAPEDEAEARRTHVLLPEGKGALARSLGDAVARVAARSPGRFATASALAAQLARRSDRRAVHGAYLVEACRLVVLCEELGCHHVHAHFGTNSTAVALLAHALGGPTFSFTAHGPEEFDRPDLLALEEKIAAALFVVGVSSFGRSQILRRTPASEWHKVLVVPCGVDDSFLGSQWLRPLPDSRRLVCVGRLCEQKGQLLLVSAAAAVRDVLATLDSTGPKRSDPTFELVLVGDGEMRPALEELISQNELQGIVRITGWASGDTVRDELNAARALVLPSFAEGLPVVIMEALALQRPVISTFVAGIPELVTPNCGWLVPAGSVQPLVDAMLRCLRTPVDELTRMGEAGRARVLERHDARIAARLLMDAFPTA